MVSFISFQGGPNHDPALIQPCALSGHWYPNSPYATGPPILPNAGD